MGNIIMHQNHQTCLQIYILLLNVIQIFITNRPKTIFLSVHLSGWQPDSLKIIYDGLRPVTTPQMAYKKPVTLKLIV